jgi:hypothetical protein
VWEVLVCTRRSFFEARNTRESKNVHSWAKHSLNCLTGSCEAYVLPLCFREQNSWIPSSEGVAPLASRTWIACLAPVWGLEIILVSIVFNLAPLGRSWCHRDLLRSAQSFPGSPVSSLQLANCRACSHLVTSDMLGAGKATSQALSADLSFLDRLSHSASFSSCLHHFPASDLWRLPLGQWVCLGFALSA